MTRGTEEFAASRRYQATAPRIKTKWAAVVVYGSMGVLLILGYAAHAAGWSPLAGHTLVLLFVLVPYGAFVAWAMRPKTVPIDVTAERLTVNQGAGGVFPLLGATLGEWYVPVFGTSGGMALHVSDGRRRFVLGGLYRRTDTGVRLEASPVNTVDASISAADFDELLAVFGGRAGLGARAAEVQGPVRCDLFENSTLQRTVAGLKVRRPRPKVRIELSDGVIRLIDAKTNSLIAWAALSQVTASPGQHTFKGRLRITWPLLDVRVPGLQRMLIANPEGQRYMWRGKVSKLGNADFIVSTADWLTLVETFGLTNYQS
jgi:hypothetical protein